MSNTINTIQVRMLERLRLGLGNMVAFVGSYGGELDDEIFESIRQLPAVWVTYGGADQIKCANTARSRYQDVHKMIVMCAVRSLRSEAATRIGGAHLLEVGVNQLVDCVKYLLTNQTLKDPVTGSELIFNGLNPKRTRTLFNNRLISNGALSVFAVEFEAIVNNIFTLEDGRYPLLTADINHPDYIFSHYQTAKKDVPHPDLLSVHGRISDAVTGNNPDAAFIESVTKFETQTKKE